MGMYFLACGTSRSLFNVLNHAGIALSYTQAISKLKRLSKERLTEMTSASATFPCPTQEDTEEEIVDGLYTHLGQPQYCIQG